VSKHETPITRWYWQQLGGLLVEEYCLVDRGPTCSARWVDALVLPEQETRIAVRGEQVDARGTGASFGIWGAPFSPEEVKDYGEVVNWIISQPWSNGKVGAFGNSYEGNTALWLAVNMNPAVKAVIPRHFEFDEYNETPFPGGILTDWMIKAWNLIAVNVRVHNFSMICFATNGIISRSLACPVVKMTSTNFRPSGSST